MSAIDVLKESRQTHVEWRDYFKKNPELQKLNKYKCLGDVEFHEKCVTNYDNAIAELAAKDAEIELLKGIINEAGEILHNLPQINPAKVDKMITAAWDILDI